MSVRKWQSIPKQKIAIWRDIFSASRDGSHLKGLCPVCLTRALRLYYQVGPATDSFSGGQHFVARGACWEWCHNCWTYEHYSALVPAWWKVDIIIDETLLTALPDVLEDAYNANGSAKPSRDWRGWRHCKAGDSGPARAGLDQLRCSLCSGSRRFLERRKC